MKKILPVESGGQRLDAFLAESLEGYTRSFLKEIIGRGLVTVNGEPRQVVMDTCARFRQREPARQILGDLVKRFGPVVRRGGPPGSKPGAPMNPGGNDRLRKPPPRPGRPGMGDGHGGNRGPGGDPGRPRPPRRPGGGGTGGGGI